MSYLDKDRDLDLDRERDDTERERDLAGDLRDAFFGDLLCKTQNKQIRPRDITRQSSYLNLFC